MTLIACGFLETRLKKAAVQFLSDGKKCELFVDYFSRSALRITANLVVSTWAYWIKQRVKNSNKVLVITSEVTCM